MESGESNPYPRSEIRFEIRDDMPRRREIPKRELVADPLYNSTLVSKFINTVMSRRQAEHRGAHPVRELRHHQGAHRRRPAEGLQEGASRT